MVLEYAPVTGFTLIIGAISSAVTLEYYMKPITNPLAAAAAAANFMKSGSRDLAGGIHHNGSHNTLSSSSLSARSSFSLASLLPFSLWSMMKEVGRLSLEAIPMGPCGSKLSDILCTLSIVYQMRTLERRWGSNTFLAFLLSASAIGIATAHTFVTESPVPVLSVTAVRVISGVASLVPLVALATRYVQEVPNISSLQLSIPLTSITITEKVFFIAPLIKLVMWPNKELQSSGYRRGAIMMDLGVWTRLLFTFIGFLFAIFSDSCWPIKLWLHFFRHWCCRPVLYFLRPLLRVIFGPSSTIEHNVPKVVQRQQLASQSNGRWGNTDFHTLPNQGNHHHSRSRHGDRHSLHAREFAPNWEQQLPEEIHRRNHNNNNNIYTDANTPSREHGRVMVDNLTGSPASPQFAIFSPIATSTTTNNNRSNNRSNRANVSTNREGSSTRDRYAPQVAQIEELNLQVGRHEIIHALAESNGDVNAAVQLLLHD